MEWTKNFHLVDSLVIEIPIWTLYYVTRKYLDCMQYYMMLLDQFDHTGKGPGYCYLIGRGPNSCLFGHVTGLLFCLYAKLFLPSIFKSVDFSSSIFGIVIVIELTEKNIIKELGLFIDGSV